MPAAAHTHVTVLTGRNPVHLSHIIRVGLLLGFPSFEVFG